MLSADSTAWYLPRMSPVPSRRVTSRDVAARAGVSQATVSLVLSGAPQGRIGPAARERVLRAARDLGYEPNLVARSLVQGRSFAIGVIVPSFRDPFFADAIAGAQRVAREEGYAVILAEADETAVESTVAMLRGRQIDGVLIDAVGAALVSAPALNGLTVVSIDDASGPWPSVTSDAEEAGRLAARHLLDLGHRACAFLGPLTEAHAFRLRERGFTQALRAADATPTSDCVRRVPATAAGGRAGMDALLALHPRPTAVFCANDLIALGALKACVRAGLRLPEQMSIVGCDDIEGAELVTPELTTIALRPRELGARAARMLLQAIAGREVPKRPKALDVKLVVRGTTAPPPRRGRRHDR